MGIVDFHTHILPGADHGSKNLGMSLSQLSLLGKNRCEIVLATPHFYPQVEPVDLFLARRERSFRELQKGIREVQAEGRLQQAPEILLGAEVLLCEGLLSCPRLRELCVEGCGIFLLEMPLRRWSSSDLRAGREFIEGADFPVVLAHIDRYEEGDVAELLLAGAKAQINAKLFSSPFRWKKYQQWIDDGSIVAIGSDLHGIEEGYTDMKRAEKKLGERFSLLEKRSRELLKKN